MPYRIACQCGKSVFAEATDAGARVKCGCGRVVVVPNLTSLRRMTESDRGKGQSRPPSEAETDARRNLSSGRLWLLGGVVILGVGVLLSGSQFPPGMCLDLIGVGAVILGLLRLIRGWVQRRMGER